MVLKPKKRSLNFELSDLICVFDHSLDPFGQKIVFLVKKDQLEIDSERPSVSSNKKINANSGFEVLKWFLLRIASKIIALPGKAFHV